ncbi:MAG: nitroreductase family deazaflavin-dependent oxidoreductase [Acidimicrobiia bacterium]|nr:nitroreductase family deazaflavin-dependent oxidoreductase [Acidimicrobiia bacterium]
MADHNAAIISEFRANGGKVGGPFHGASLLLLHSTGARTGEERVHPMMYQAVDGGYAVFASKAGADSSPAWFHNLVANPHATIEIGPDTLAVTARVLDDLEREPIWERQKRAYPGFAEYEQRTNRVIPVVLLEPRDLEPHQ